MLERSAHGGHCRALGGSAKYESGARERGEVWLYKEQHVGGKGLEEGSFLQHRLWMTCDTSFSCHRLC